MCGRIARTSSREVLVQEFGISKFVNVDRHPRYNIPPTRMVESVIHDRAERHLGPMRWGVNRPRV